MNDATLRQALDYARRGWPVFPCQPGQKTPATQHGYLDATTDEQQITAWFGQYPGCNLAIATGTPGPDVLDVDQRGEAGSGFPAFAKLHDTGLLHGATAYVKTPSGGVHAYFTGSRQRSGRLPAHHLDFRAAGGYVLAPPSRISSRHYEHFKTLHGDDILDWQAVTRLLEPGRQQQPAPRQHHEHEISRLAGWVAAQREGNRNDGLFWAANRALETDRAADLSPLAAAARQAGLDDPEITRTLDSARRTTQACRQQPEHQAEGAS